MTSHRRVGAIVLTVGAAITLVGTFLSWVTSGSTERSSYEVFGLVDRLGFSTNSAIGWALRLWPLVPLSLVTTVIAHWVHHSALRWPRTALTGVALIYPGMTALAVANAPQIALFDVGPGPWVTLAGAVIMLVGAVTPWALNAIARARSAGPSAPGADRS